MEVKIHPNVSRILSFPRIAQRSPEWYEYRKKRVTASEASTIIARGKGSTRVFEEKVGLRHSNLNTECMRIGSENEEVVVRLYEKKYPEEVVFHDLSIVPHTTHDYVAASLDACTASGKNVEIKTVFKDKFMKVSKMYRDQVQLQMEVADLDVTHLVQHYVSMPGQPIVVHVILRDREWFAKNSEIFKDFVDRLRTFFPFDVEEFESQCRHGDFRPRLETPEEFPFVAEDFDVQIVDLDNALKIQVFPYFEETLAPMTY